MAERGKFQRLGKMLEDLPHFWQASEADGTSLLHWAAMRDDASFVALALKNLAVDLPGPQQQTPLMWATAAGSLAAAHVLIASGADIHARDEQGATPLLHAVQHEQRTAMLRVLAAAKEEEVKKLVAATDVKGRNAAHWAAFLGDTSSLKLLSHFGTNLLHLDERRNTALHQAVLGQQPDILEYLMDRGVDPELHNADGASCVDLARDGGHKATISALERLLKPKGIDVHELAETGAAAFKRAEKLGVNAKDPVQLLKQYGAGLFWLSCVSITVLEYLLDSRDVAYELAPQLALGFELGTLGCLLLWLFIATGNPGKLEPAPAGRTPGLEAYLGLLRSGQVVEASRLCTTTWLLKDLRTKYDTMSGGCIQEFDHFCNFTGCAIGRFNHRQFILLNSLEPLTQLSYLGICVLVAYRPVGMPQDFSELLWLPVNMAMHMPTAALQYPFMALVSILNVVTTPAVLYLLLSQIMMISINWTVNEHINMERYSHFWVFDSFGNRSAASPFNKGSTWANWMDFCVHRRRRELGPGCPAKIRDLALALRKAGAQ
ncbi:unnamed protein product [Effrenium voratum]|nr:unnamed protein product [Effrenium voratum]